MLLALTSPLWAVDINVVDTVTSFDHTAANHLQHTEPSSCEDASSVEPSTWLPTDSDDVDDGLMDALAAWSVLCSRFNAANFDPALNSYYTLRDSTYLATYESFMKYFGRSQLRAISLRRFFSTMLQTNLKNNPRAIYSQIFKDICDRMHTTLQDAGGNNLETTLGTAEANQILNEQCLEIVSYKCALETSYEHCFHRKQSSELVTHLFKANLLNDKTVRACLLHIVSPPELPDTSSLKFFCSFLTDNGKDLDRKSCCDLMDNVFANLRKYAMEWRFQSAQQNIVVSTFGLSQLTRADFAVSEIGCPPSQGLGDLTDT
jgi:hypothetical protein